MLSNNDHDNIVSKDHEFIKDEFMSKLTQMLEGYDWKERMKLKCQSYIKQNGTKTTTVDEIMDNIEYEAFKTFPGAVKAEMKSEVIKYIKKIELKVLDSVPGNRTSDVNCDYDN